MKSDRLIEAIRRLRKSSPARVDLAPVSTFDAVLEQRVSQLERHVDEVNTRVNGLIFVVAGAVVVQVVLGFFR